MKVEVVERILRALGSRRINRYPDYVACSCVLAPWTHGRKTGEPEARDRKPSALVNIHEVEPSRYNCLTCHERGTLGDIVWRRHQFEPDRWFDLYQEVDDLEIAALGDMAEHFVLARGWGEGHHERDIGSTSSEHCFSDDELKGFAGGVPRYAILRGLTIDTCRRWELGYDRNPQDPRLTFPVRDRDGHLVGIAGRAINAGQEPKYRDYWGFRKSLYLYGEHLVGTRSLPFVLIEGQFDVLVIDQHAGDLVVPLGILGNLPSAEQCRKVAAFSGARLVLTLFDQDRGGDAARQQVDYNLAKYLPVQHLSVPPGRKDAGECAADELRQIFEA